MSDYDNSNSGALFKNARKTMDKHPDYRGEINVDGTEYWLSAWLKTSKKGEKYLSLAVSSKNEQQAGKAPAAIKTEEPPFTDDIPF